jgi:hypothetical protein
LRDLEEQGDDQDHQRDGSHNAAGRGVFPVEVRSPCLGGAGCRAEPRPAAIARDLQVLHAEQAHGRLDPDPSSDVEARRRLLGLDPGPVTVEVHLFPEIEEVDLDRERVPPWTTS